MATRKAFCGKQARGCGWHTKAKERVFSSIEAIRMVERNDDKGL